MRARRHLCIGGSHTVTVDRDRPHVVWAILSDVTLAGSGRVELWALLSDVECGSSAARDSSALAGDERPIEVSARTLLSDVR